jgi:antitoxin component YwqK of YwqJK toxin-antitoxin module
VAYHDNGDKDYEASYYDKRFHGVFIKYVNNKIRIKTTYEHGERKVYEKFNDNGERICYFELRDKYVVGPWFRDRARFDGKVYTANGKKYEFGPNTAFISLIID